MEMVLRMVMRKSVITYYIQYWGGLTFKKMYTIQLNWLIHKYMQIQQVFDPLSHILKLLFILISEQDTKFGSIYFFLPSFLYIYLYILYIYLYIIYILIIFYCKIVFIFIILLQNSRIYISKQWQIETLSKIIH